MMETEVIIVGSGVAALTTAYYLHEHKNVIIFTKTKKDESNSRLAQGGVAASVSPEDDWRCHVEDTIAAGCQHNDEKAVELLVREGPKRIREWMNAGLTFDVNQDGSLHLGQEGGHRKRRILHAGGDQTGRTIVSFLLEKLKGHVEIIEGECVIELIIQHGRCIGVKTKNPLGQTSCYYAGAVVLAAGGCAGMYAFSSNAATATGDGVALAYRAGAVIADVEFIQFHPTMLFAAGKAAGLISEAVRGEGAVLVTEDGRRIMEHIHPLQDLAPRDIVARAIYDEMSKGHHVYLDISAVHRCHERFPALAHLCAEHGIDMETGRLPIVPGAHFLMGGVFVNDCGQTSIQGLYAVGEVACTGVHGANRLASNSLLEGIVFGARAAEAVRKETAPPPRLRKRPNDMQSDIKKAVRNLPEITAIQTIMSTYVGIVRDEQGLQYAKKWFEQFPLSAFVDSSLEDLSIEEITVIHMLLAGWLITTSALQRTESRGGHYRSDYPFAREQWKKRRICRTKNELNVTSMAEH
ncbi:L-aspartate oxidase [Parageobacillus thermoglucosidasius]|uniref:L-aspartate oxidase n=1 Tax=Parageobacillus thermoglucosidasius TaxID=1426 RepID=UPI0030C7193F